MAEGEEHGWGLGVFFEVGVCGWEVLLVIVWGKGNMKEVGRGGAFILVSV